MDPQRDAVSVGEATLTAAERALLIAVARAVLATTGNASTGYLRGRRMIEIADLQRAVDDFDRAAYEAARAAADG